MVANKKLRQLIELTLAEKPECRDDDNRLIANIWRKEIIDSEGKNGYDGKSAHQFLYEVAIGKLSNPESIRRIRQKIQEKQPLLRGAKYRDRQKYQGEVKKEIRAFYSS